MNSSDFLELLRTLTHLSSIQRERAQQHIQHHLQADLLWQSLSEQHGDEPICCPHCHSIHVIHWGQSHGSLRYRCKGCHRTFNQLTDSSLSGLRRKEKWVAYAQCLNDGMTLQATADKCRINLKTSFRWWYR